MLIHQARYESKSVNVQFTFNRTNNPQTVELSTMSERGENYHQSEIPEGPAKKVLKEISAFEIYMLNTITNQEILLQSTRSSSEESCTTKKPV